MEVEFTQEHPDLMLPSNLESALKKAISIKDVTMIEQYTNEIARLIQL